jgi:dynein heavy chain
MGVLHKQQGRLEEAIAAYEQALAAAPNLEVVLLNMAAALTEHGTHLKAAGGRLGCIALPACLGCPAPASPAGFAARLLPADLACSIGPMLASEQHPWLACCAVGRLAEGVASYERALALQPRHAEALYNLGVAYTEQGQLDKALFM